MGVDPCPCRAVRLGTVLPINMGALAFVAAWLIGMFSLGLAWGVIVAPGWLG